jgi:hypothetical protein
MGRVKWAGHGKISWRPKGSRVDIKMSVRVKRCMDKEWTKVAWDKVILWVLYNHWILQVELISPSAAKLFIILGRRPIDVSISLL